jgi:hypothetical protein
MRKFAWLFVAAGLAVPTGFIVTQSASAAGGTTCAKGAGKFTLSPAVKALQATAAAETGEVATTSKSTGTLSGCSGGGVTSAKSIAATLKIADPTNCNSQIDLKEPAAAPPTVGPLKITWNTGKTTTVAAAKLTSSVPAKVGGLHIGGKITAGLFAGLTISGDLTFAAGTGQCISKPFTSGTYASNGKFKIA